MYVYDPITQTTSEVPGKPAPRRTTEKVYPKSNHHASEIAVLEAELNKVLENNTTSPDILGAIASNIRHNIFRLKNVPAGCGEIAKEHCSSESVVGKIKSHDEMKKQIEDRKIEEALLMAELKALDESQTELFQDYIPSKKTFKRREVDLDIINQIKF